MITIFKIKMMIQIKFKKIMFSKYNKIKLLKIDT